MSVHVWQDALEAALQETDPEQILLRVRNAETMIFGRIEEINPGQDIGEEQALYDALGALRVVIVRRGSAKDEMRASVI